MKKLSTLLLSLTLAISANTYATTTLDVMVLYPQSVQNAYGSGINNKIDTLVSWANQAYQNTGMDIELSLVHNQVLNLTNDHEVSSSLLNTVADVTTTSVMDLRDTHKPSLTIYLTAASSSYCGLAYYPNRGDNVMTPGGRFGNNSVRIPEIAFDAVGLVGHNCSNYVFTHEVGHTLGAGHSRVQNSNGHPISTSRGYGISSQFVTIMAYASEFNNAPKLQYHSDPNTGSCNGYSCGTSIDNAADGIESFVDDHAQYFSSCWPHSATYNWRPNVWVYSCN